MSSRPEHVDPLRVIIITEDDPLYVIRFFEEFFPTIPETIEVIGITVSEAFHEPIMKTAWRMLRFYGPVDFTRLCARYAMVKLRGRSIERLASDVGIELFRTPSVNDAAYLDQLRSLEPDVIMSVAAPEIFRADLLAVPALGCVNIHSGRLPAYRGMMPTFWQLLAGESHATVTVHEMVEQLDMGRILATLEFPLMERDRLDRVINGTKKAGAGLMLDVLEQIRTDSTQPRELDLSESGYHSFPRPGDVRAFRRRGHRML
ncbi:MAG: hypothetical protein CMJ36_01165 [Phycisphaerae bacterium]|nr:hypothetical protein [Phycisphaerae bacterium]